MRSIIDITDLEVAEVGQLLETAHEIIADPRKYQQAAGGKILATLFYEPSTRTRLSFESAMYSLGGNVISVPSASNSSAAKGETISDTLKVVSNYADIVAIRHPNDGAALAACEAAGVPVINAGDGGHFHPTQTLADLLTIERHFGKLEGLTIVCVGDLLYGRTVHSLLHAMIRYPKNRFVMVSPDELRLPAEFSHRIREAGGELAETSVLAEALAEADVIYMTRVQQERFADREQYERLKDAFILDSQMMEAASEAAIVLHPLPRVNEISVDFDNDPRAKYFEQTFNGKIMRAALIKFLLADAVRNPQKVQRDEIAAAELIAASTNSALSCTNSRCVTHIERGIRLRAHLEHRTCVYCGFVMG
ncbi:aspartate carbamoyltransferase [Arcanobacterium hippocoleae]